MTIAKIFLPIPFLLAFPAVGQVYKCPQDDGRIVYQQQPCADGKVMKTEKISEARRLEAAADTIEREAREISNQSIKMKVDGFPISLDEIVERKIRMEKRAKEMREQAQELREAERAAPTD